MTGVDIEVARAGLVIGLIIAALLYHFVGVVSGGAVTGSYIALMVMGQNWLDIAGWVILSLIGVGAIRLAAHIWPLPRNWLFAIGILVPAGLHSVGVALASLDVFSGWSTFLLAGLFITNGLTAYDAQRQGIWKTFAGAAVVGLLTYLVLIPVNWGMELVRDAPALYSAPTLQDPIVVFTAVAIALSVRVGLRLGTAGIIGVLFFLDMANIASAVVVIAMALIGTVIYRLVADRLGLTPRQRLYSMLAVGAIVSWFGLFWAEWLGVPGAERAHEFGVEPLLVIGLMMGEMVRYGIPRMLAGSVLVFALAWGVSVLAASSPLLAGAALVGGLAIATAFFAIGAARVRREWAMAWAGGDRHAQSRQWAEVRPVDE